MNTRIVILRVFSIEIFLDIKKTLTVHIILIIDILYDQIFYYIELGVG